MIFSIRKRLLLGTVLAPVLLVAACSASEPETTYSLLLDQIPDTSQTRVGVFLNDFEMAAEVAGISPPDESATADQVIDYLVELSIPPMQIAGHIFVSGWNDFATIFAQQAASRGYDQRHVSATASTGELPRIYEIAYGRFNPAEFATEDPCDECPDFEMFEHKDVKWHSWGDGYSEQQNLHIRHVPPVFDNFGRGGNWLVEENQVIRTLARDDMRDLIDARAGEIDTLGDRKEFMALANAMTELHAYSIYISDKTIEKRLEVYSKPGGYGFSPEQEAALRERLEELPALRPYTAYALGSGLDEDGPFTAAAFYFRDKKDAESSVDELRDAIGEGRSNLDQKPFSRLIIDLETEIDGNVLKAKLRHEEDGQPLWAAFLNNGDMSLFAHE